MMFSLITFDRRGRETTASSTISLLMVLTYVLFSASSTVLAEERVLKLGVRTDAPPFSSKADKTPYSRNIENNYYDGYTVQLCRLIAEEAIDSGLFDKAVMIEVTVENRFQQLRDGKIDMLCGASTVTLERMRVVDFTLMTFLSGASVMYNKTSFNEQVEDKENCSLNIGVLNHTTTEDGISHLMSKFQNQVDDAPADCAPQPVWLNSHDEVFDSMQEGRINVYLADREILLALNKRFGGVQEKSQQAEPQEIEVSEHYFTYEPYAIGVNIKQRELRVLANRVLSRLFDWRKGLSGDNIATVLRRYFPSKKFSKDLEYMFRLQQIQQGNRITE